MLQLFCYADFILMPALLNAGNALSRNYLTHYLAMLLLRTIRNAKMANMHSGCCFPTDDIFVLLKIHR